MHAHMHAGMHMHARACLRACARACERASVGACVQFRRTSPTAGNLPTLGSPVTKMLAHTLPRAVDAVDFLAVEKRRSGCAGCRA